MYLSPEELGTNGERGLGNWERPNEGGGIGAQGVTKHRRDITGSVWWKVPWIKGEEQLSANVFDHVPLNVAQSGRAFPQSLLFLFL